MQVCKGLMMVRFDKHPSIDEEHDFVLGPAYVDKNFVQSHILCSHNLCLRKRGFQPNATQRAPAICDAYVWLETASNAYGALHNGPVRVATFPTSLLTPQFFTRLSTAPRSASRVFLRARSRTATRTQQRAIRHRASLT